VKDPNCGELEKQTHRKLVKAARGCCEEAIGDRRASGIRRPIWALLQRKH